MYKVGKPYFVGIVAFKEEDQEDIDVLCLVDNEDKIEELFDETESRLHERFNTSLVNKEEMRRKYATKDKKIEIEVFFVERMLAGNKHEIRA